MLMYVSKCLLTEEKDQRVQISGEEFPEHICWVETERVQFNIYLFNNYYTMYVASAKRFKLHNE